MGQGRGHVKGGGEQSALWCHTTRQVPPWPVCLPRMHANLCGCSSCRSGPASSPCPEQERTPPSASPRTPVGRGYQWPGEGEGRGGSTCLCPSTYLNQSVDVFLGEWSIAAKVLIRIQDCSFYLARARGGRPWLRRHYSIAGRALYASDSTRNAPRTQPVSPRHSVLSYWPLW